MISKRIAVMLFVGFLFTAISSAAEAKPEFFQRIPANYQQSCNLCHVAPPVLNDFGREFKAAGFSFTELEARRSPQGAGGGAAITGAEQANIRQDKSTTLRLILPERVARGELVELKAQLTDQSGKPIPGAPVSFSVPTSFFINGDMFISKALTDNEGIAKIRYTPKLNGPMRIKAGYAGGSGYQPVEAKDNLGLRGDTPPYAPDWRLRIPFLSSWLILLVVAMVWIAYGITYGNLVAIRQEGFSMENAHRARREA